MAEKTPKPRMVPDPPADDEELCELFDEDDRDTPVPCSALAHIKVFRVNVDPESGKETPGPWVVELRPNATYADLAAQCGGGVYVLRGWNKRYVCGRRLAIDGAPRTARGTNVNPLATQPVHEMASGLVAVTGLSPEAQFMYSLLQQTNAQTREDMRFMLKTMGDISAAYAAKPEPRAANPNVELLTSMMQELRSELATSRKTVETERENNIVLAMDKLKLRYQKDDDAPGKVLVSKISERADDVFGLIAMYLQQRGLIPQGPNGVQAGVQIMQQAAAPLVAAVTPGVPPAG
jgi:hypothetical protein